MTELRPVAPASLDWLVRGCLTKDPTERWQTAHDVKLQLERTAEGRADIETKAELRRRSPGLLGATVVLAVTSVLLAVFALVRGEPEDLESIRFAVRPPEGTSITLGPAAPQVAVSPDGRQLVFATGGSGESGLWIRSLDALEARKLSGTDGADIPFWSPDGRFVGFFAGGLLYKIEPAGGAPQVLCEAPSISRGGAWNRDGVILLGTLEGIARVSASGGATSLVTMIDRSRGENRHVWPQFLPDGRHFLYLAMSSDDDHSGIYVGSLDSSDTRFLVEAEVFARYTAPGYLLFVREAMLMAQAFDATSFELAGEPHRIADGLGYNPGNGRTTFSVSDAGVLAYRAGGLGGRRDRELTWFDREGERLGAVAPPGRFANVALSPDEMRLAVERVDETGNRDVWIIEVSSGAFSRFTFGASRNAAPLWSSDGARVLFTSGSDIYAKPASGAGREELIVESDELKLATSMSPNGDYTVYQSQSSATGWDILVTSADSPDPEPFLQTEFNERNGKLSPDGMWLAYTSDESGRYEVYVTSFPDREGRWQVSTEGGGMPQWRGDGRELFYRGPANVITAVDVKLSPTFEHGSPRPLFSTLMSLASRQIYDVTADVERFLVNAEAEETAAIPITVVVNWTTALEP